MIRARFELRRKLQGINSDYKTRDPTDDHNCKQLDKAEEFRKECVICLSGPADAVIMKCGHGGLCFDCG